MGMILADRAMADVKVVVESQGGLGHLRRSLSCFGDWQRHRYQVPCGLRLHDPDWIQQHLTPSSPRTTPHGRHSSSAPEPSQVRQSASWLPCLRLSRRQTELLLCRGWHLQPSISRIRLCSPRHHHRRPNHHGFQRSPASGSVQGRRPRSHRSARRLLLRTDGNTGSRPTIVWSGRR